MTDITSAKAIIAGSSVDLRQRAMLVQLNIGMPRNAGRDRKVTKELHRSKNALPGAGAYSKRLYDKESLHGLRTAQSQARRHTERPSAPWAADGLRILPTSAVLELQEALARSKRAFETAKRKFIDNHDSIVAKQVARLGEMFDPAAYQTEAQLEAAIYFSVDFIPMPTSEDWRIDLPDEALNSLINSTKRAQDRVLKDAVQSCFDRLYPVLHRTAERLARYSVSPGDGTGTRGNTFHATIVSNWNELVDVLPGLNLLNDEGLAEAIEKMRAIMPEGTTVDALRTDAVLRKRVADGASHIRGEVEGRTTAAIIERSHKETSAETGADDDEEDGMDADQQELMSKVDSIF